MQRLRVDIKIDQQVHGETIVTPCMTPDALGNYVSYEQAAARGAGRRKLASQLETVAAERDALAAQVEVLRGAALYAIDIILDGNAKRALLDACNSTPAACLAQVRAEAGRAGFILGHSLHADIMKAVYNGEWDAITRFADQYAERILKGGK